MTSWDYNTATSTLLGAFSSLLPPHSPFWYICIFPRQLSCSKGSGASWELPCTRGEGLSSSPGVYLEFAQQQLLHCHPVQEDILGQIRAASGAGSSPHRYHPACVGLQPVGKHFCLKFPIHKPKTFDCFWQHSWLAAGHLGTSGWSVLACTQVINDVFSGGLIFHLWSALSSSSQEAPSPVRGLQQKLELLIGTALTGMSGLS